MKSATANTFVKSLQQIKKKEPVFFSRMDVCSDWFLLCRNEIERRWRFIEGPPGTFSSKDWVYERTRSSISTLLFSSRWLYLM